MEFETVQDDGLHEDLGIKWHEREIFRLDEILRSAGVPSPAVRQEIAEAFFFNQAVQFDGGCVGGVVEHDGQGYHPRLAFMAEGGQSPTLLRPTDAYDLHDYTHSTTGELYE